MLKQGIDALDFSVLRGKRVALIANHTSVDKNGVSTLQLLLNNGVDVTALFSLEHGYFPVAQDMEPVGEENTLFSVSVYSLYGEDESSLNPDSGLFDLFDTVVYDVQDVGSRYYTYVQSLTIFMDHLEKKPKELIVLDRVNPIGGKQVEGAFIEEPYYSFVGRFPLLHRHGLTSAEIALYFYDTNGYTFPFQIVRAEGWERDSYFDNYDYPWIPTSPNMPTLDTAIVYPGGCLVEGTNLSEGRGTTAPFLLTGASGVDPFDLKNRLDKLELEGVVFTPMEFRPMFQKEKMNRCGGIYLSISDRRKFKPFRCYLAILNTFMQVCGIKDFFRKKAYEFVEDVPAIELLLGEKQLIDMFYRLAPIDEVDDYLSEREDKWRTISEPFHLY